MQLVLHDTVESYHHNMATDQHIHQWGDGASWYACKLSTAEQHVNFNGKTKNLSFIYEKISTILKL